MMIKLGETFALFLNRVTIKVKPELSLDFTRYPHLAKSRAKVYVLVCACDVSEWAEHKTRSALTPPVGPLTEVQLLEAEMHFLSSHHWHPLVLAVQLAQSENR